MKRLILLALMLIASMTAFGQTAVRGQVTDASGGPLPGVAVLVPGTSIAAITDADGAYSITVPSDKEDLLFSCYSYEDQQVTIAGRAIVDVVLKEDTEMLEEVVVVGFGTVKKRDLTSSITSVAGDELKKTSFGNALQSLQGQAAGVQIVGNSSPGGSPKIFIRGFSTVNLDTNPLIVVDGAPSSGSDLNWLSSNEIESIEVLKDASACAIYGSRASNGVLMITTKRGHEGKPQFSFDFNYGSQLMTPPYKMADAVEYAKIFNTAMTNSGYPETYPDPESYAGKTTNWWAAGIRTLSPQFNGSFSVNGGNKMHRYSVGLTYWNQRSFYEKGGYERITARIVNDFDFAPWLKAGITLNPRYQSWGSPSNWSDFLRVDPITGIYKDPADYTGDENEYSIYARSFTYVWNPVATVKRWDNSNVSYALTTDAYIQIEPIKGLVIRSQGNVEVDARRSDTFTPDFVIDPAHEFQTYNAVSRSQPMYFNWSLQNTITYSTTFGKSHNFTAMVGQTLEEWNGSSLWAEKYDLPNNSEYLREIDAGTLNPQCSGTSYTASVLSFLARVMYNYDSRYYITASWRMDGSSKFLAKNKWAQFPSVSAAWRISEEGFMEGTRSFLNELKLRVGWGRVGNQNLPSSVYLSKLSQGYTSINDVVVNYSMPAVMKNEDIKWETVEDMNIGIDYAFFDSSLSGSIELYRKKTIDMLFEKAFPSFSGFPNDAKIWTNIGSMRTQGLDFSIAYRKNFGDFYFDGSLTLTTFNVKMLEMASKEPLYGNSEKTRTEVNMVPGYFYGYKCDGIFQNTEELNAHTNDKGKKLQPYAQPGDFRFVDVNKDGELNADDRTMIGSPWADFTSGLNITLGYKNFDVAMSFYASVGNDLVNENNSELFNCVGYTNKIAGLSDMAWHGEGTSNTVPRLSTVDNNENFVKFSSFFIEDGSFLRMKNLQIGYNIDKIKFMQKFRLYIAALNLFTITKYSGVDPEVAGGVTSFGFGGWGYPTQRTFVFGINMNF